MAIIVEKVSNRLMMIGTYTETNLDGYPTMDYNNAFIPETIDVYLEVSNIPEEVTKEPRNWCYTSEKGFYEYIEPKTYEEKIEEQYRERLVKEVNENGYLT